MRFVVKISFYLLAFTPIVAYFVYNNLNYNYYWYSGAIFSAIAVFYLLVVKQERGIIELPIYIKFYLALFIFYFLRAFVDDFSVQGSFVKFLYKNAALFPLFILLLIKNYSFSTKFIQNVLKIFKITIVLAFIVILIQYFVKNDFLMPQDQNFRYINSQWGVLRFPSIFGFAEVNDYGLAFIPIVSLVLGYYRYSYQKINLILALMVLVISILSGARYILLMLSVISLQTIFFRRRVVASVFAFIFMVPLILAAGVYFLKFAGFDLQFYYQNRLLSESYITRIFAFSVFSRFFPSHPWFGAGERVTTEMTSMLRGITSQIHVGFLSHLSEFGVIGSVFLFGAWFFLAKHMFDVAKKTNFYGSLFGFMSFIVANLALVEYSIFNYGIVFTVVFNRYFESLYLKEES